MKAPELIVWLDSCSPSNSGWMQYAAAASITPSEITSVGYVLKEKKKYIVIAAHVSPSSSQVSGSITIPRVAILSRVKLRAHAKGDK